MGAKKLRAVGPRLEDRERKGWKWAETLEPSGPKWKKEKFKNKKVLFSGAVTGFFLRINGADSSVWLGLVTAPCESFHKGTTE